MPGKPLCRVFAALAVLILASCVSTSYVVRKAELPPDLDSWLAAKEASVAGVIPESQKAIAWAGELGAKTPFSIVYIHGWQGSSRDYAAVLQTVAAELGANVYYSRL